ncbi:hypothetical protein [Anaeromyxobacter oryzisoli]|uniref:hypothetical protein n=1 Tax=Anaeromyxobacter oryzisoli TaxID=2925408 RepID=UPI001F588DDB|nr:hypothetical protein [Anaeromyxobacter sp. SG63]
MDRGHTPAPGRTQPRRVFLLSPARAGGERMALVLSPGARFALARAVQGEGGAPLADVFLFASGLYFRGKLAYALAFATPPPGVPGALVIAPGAGLVPVHARVRAADLRALAEVRVHAREPRFREPLERDARALAEALGPGGEVVLLGSVASPKYVEPLLGVLGARLLFPLAFVGRGDMSRGGLLLRAVRAGTELAYGPVAGAVLHGPRPPRLEPLRRAPAPRPQPRR